MTNALPTTIRFGLGKTLKAGETSMGYAKVDGEEIKTLILNIDGEAYAKRLGGDAGITRINPSTTILL